jgi:hypothetical protein
MSVSFQLNMQQCLTHMNDVTRSLSYVRSRKIDLSEQSQIETKIEIRHEKKKQLE